jgi:hypothetical protein
MKIRTGKATPTLKWHSQALSKRLGGNGLRMSVAAFPPGRQSPIRPCCLPGTPTQLNTIQPNNLLPFPFSAPSWHPLHSFSQQPSHESRSVYRTDDGYVHLSVSVLKAAGIWDESWDATDGTLFLQHITRLDARTKSDQEQICVLEAHRDALAKDRALQRYTNISKDLDEMRQQIKQLQDDAKLLYSCEPLMLQQPARQKRCAHRASH